VDFGFENRRGQQIPIPKQYWKDEHFVEQYFKTFGDPDSLLICKEIALIAEVIDSKNASIIKYLLNCLKQNLEPDIDNTKARWLLNFPICISPEDEPCSILQHLIIGHIPGATCAGYFELAADPSARFEINQKILKNRTAKEGKSKNSSVDIEDYDLISITTSGNNLAHLAASEFNLEALELLKRIKFPLNNINDTGFERHAFRE
jgi:hypothetical protein